MIVGDRVTLAEFLGSPEIEELRLELKDGRVVEREPRRWGHGRVAGRFGALLDRYGHAGVSPRAVIEGNGERGECSLLPDVAFYRSDPPADNEGMSRAPAVVVEIRERAAERAPIEARIACYLGWGVESAWLVYLDRESVEVCEGGASRTLAGADVLSSAAVPGLRVPVAAIFATR